MDREFPVVALLTVVRFSGEFALIEVRMQGDEVVSRDVLEHSHQFADVWEAFKIASHIRFGKKEIQ